MLKLQMMLQPRARAVKRLLRGHKGMKINPPGQWHHESTDMANAALATRARSQQLAPRAQKNEQIISQRNGKTNALKLPMLLQPRARAVKSLLRGHRGTKIHLPEKWIRPSIEMTHIANATRARSQKLSPRAQESETSSLGEMAPLRHLNDQCCSSHARAQSKDRSEGTKE